MRKNPASPSPIDEDLTLTLIDAAVQAYNSGGTVTPPDGWNDGGIWTATAGYLYNETQNVGVIFTQTFETGRNNVILAFRGTDSFTDAEFDFNWFLTSFTPKDASVTTAAQIASGYDDLYTTVPTDGSCQQAQLFAILERLKPETLYITGHSLGAAMASIFALDLGLSMQTLSEDARPKNVQTLIFSSPCAGDADFAAAYAALPWEAETPTVMVSNYSDWVPSLPPDDDYVAVGGSYLVYFYCYWWDNPDAAYIWHSALNLQGALTRTFNGDSYPIYYTGVDLAGWPVDLEAVPPPSEEETYWRKGVAYTPPPKGRERP